MKPETIKRIIDRTFGVDVSDKSRHKNVLYPRFVYCYLAYKQNEKYSLEYIGNVINRNHASVINAITKYERLTRYRDFQLYIEKAQKAITESIEVELERREKLRINQCRFHIRKYPSLKTT